MALPKAVLGQNAFATIGGTPSSPKISSPVASFSKSLPSAGFTPMATSKSNPFGSISNTPFKPPTTYKPYTPPPSEFPPYMPPLTVPPSWSNPMAPGRPSFTPAPGAPRPAPQIGTPWSFSPPPSSPAPTPGGGDSSCGAGTCAGMSTPAPGGGLGTPSKALPSGVTPAASTPAPDMSQLAQTLALMVPASQSQSVFVGGSDPSQTVPDQADHNFRGKDPGISRRGMPNYMDALRGGFWG